MIILVAAEAVHIQQAQSIAQQKTVAMGAAEAAVMNVVATVIVAPMKNVPTTIALIKHATIWVSQKTVVMQPISLAGLNAIRLVLKEIQLNA